MIMNEGVKIKKKGGGSSVSTQSPRWQLMCSVDMADLVAVCTSW